jgi:uncharacterized BrkB/YihY/UPF0761 family membrane protein
VSGHTETDPDRDPGDWGSTGTQRGAAAGEHADATHNGLLARLRARADRASAGYLRLAERRPLLGLPVTFITRYIARQGSLMASALAFCLYLWLMPLALLTAGILAGLSASNAAENASKAAGITGSASQEIITALREGHQAWWIAVLIGASGVLWGAMSVVRCAILVHAHTWQVPVPRRTQRHRVATALIFIGAWLGLAVIGAATPRLDQAVPGGFVLAVIADVGISTAVWLAVSMRLPHVRESWYDLMPGCILFGVSFAVLHTLTRVYLPSRLEQSSQLYGVLGIAGVLLAWLLAFGQVIVGAALVNVVWGDYRRAKGRNSPEA